MEVMYILVGCSLAAALGFLIAFIWALRHGQFDDLVTPAMRMLFEPDKKKKPTKSHGSVG